MLDYDLLAPLGDRHDFVVQTMCCQVDAAVDADVADSLAMAQLLPVVNEIDYYVPIVEVDVIEKDCLRS